jgi:two-component system, NarL family, sensor histidine kinase UhpB
MTSPRKWPLLWRVFAVDLVVLVAAAVLLAVGPVTVSAPLRIGELAVLFAGLVAMLSVTLVLLQRTLHPLELLTATMRSVDPLRPGQRVEAQGSDANVTALTTAFNEMLDRLEQERQSSARMALSIQEGERRRVARELHDEVGQTLTAMLLQIEAIAHDAPQHLRDELDHLRETARSGAEDVRRISRRLRPEALEELGLRSALLSLSETTAEQAHLPVQAHVLRELPRLNREQELVIYRIAQEALTNVVRHAEARRVQLSMTTDGTAIVLAVCDDGRGFDADRPVDAHGLRGMQERAMLIGASLTISSRPRDGTRVTLRMTES